MIEYKNIHLRFGEQKLFDDFNMQVATGEKVLLRAASGKGKSTLIKLLLGFVRPDLGQVLFDGQTLNKNNVHTFRKGICYVSQDVDLKKVVVWDLLVDVFNYKINRHLKLSKKEVLSLFDLFRLEEDVLYKNINLLSGGQRQRLGFILCILLDRQVWILDEVTSGLDNELKEILVDYVVDQDKTVIVISHDDVWLRDDIKIKEW